MRARRTMTPGRAVSMAIVVAITVMGTAPSVVFAQSCATYGCAQRGGLAGTGVPTGGTPGAVGMSGASRSGGGFGEGFGSGAGADGSGNPGAGVSVPGTRVPMNGVGGSSATGGTGHGNSGYAGTGGTSKPAFGKRLASSRKPGAGLASGAGGPDAPDWNAPPSWEADSIYTSRRTSPVDDYRWGAMPK